MALAIARRREIQAGRGLERVQPERLREGLRVQGRARAIEQSMGEGAWSKVCGEGKGVAARLRRHTRGGGGLCSEAPKRPCGIWTER